MEFEDGVVIGADSRTTRGSYIANRVTDKLCQITDQIFCCRSGSAADTQAVADVVKYQLELHSIETGEASRVSTAANMFKSICYSNREQLSAGIICAGWDKYKGGQVFNIPLGGMIARQPFTIGGSGSGFIYGYCDKYFRDGMNKEEALEFVRTALAMAMQRDGSSGGVIRTAVLTEAGAEREVKVWNDVPTFYEG